MGNCQDSCKRGSKETELDIQESAYKNAIRKKAFNAQGTEDLEETFIEILRRVEYPDPNVKVILMLYP